jgi:hypothetical protein
MENFEIHLRALLSHIDAAADNVAQDYELTSDSTDITANDVDFFSDDAGDLLQSQSLFLEAIAARYRRALARVVNTRLFTEGV